MSQNWYKLLNLRMITSKEEIKESLEKAVLNGILTPEDGKLCARDLLTSPSMRQAYDTNWYNEMNPPALA